MEEVIYPETSVTLPIDTPCNQSPHLNVCLHFCGVPQICGYPAIISHRLSWWVWVVESLPHTRVWNVTVWARKVKTIWTLHCGSPGCNKGRCEQQIMAVGCMCLCARQFLCSSGVPRNFVEGFNKFSWEQRERGSGGGSPLVRGSGGSCNLVQEISFHIVKFS